MRRILLPALCVGLAACSAAQGRPAQGPPPGPAARTAAGTPAGPQAAARDTAKKSPYKPWAEVTRDATERQGFLTTYEKGDALFLAIPADRLGKDFLLTTQIAQGIGAAGIYGGTMMGIFEGQVVAFERRGDRVLLVRRPVRFTAPEGSPAARGVEVGYGSSVLDAAKIESIRDDGTILVNAYDWFVSDLAGIGEYLRYGLATTPSPNPPPVSFDKNRSALESVKAFPMNVNVRARLTFRPSQPVFLPSVTDGRFVPVTVAYVMTDLPAEPMTPRVGDDRVGYFLTVRKDFSQDDQTFFRRYINHWRLEPGEPAENGLVRPRKPIVYYIDPSVPEEYRPYLEAGVEAWNSAFEAAGWKDAIRAEPLPEGADPEDMRYPTLRWSTSDQPGYGAIGPSIVDPRTGETLDADILFEANMVRGFKREWRTTVSPAAAIEEIFAAPVQHGERASLAAELAAQGALLRTALAGMEQIGPGDPVPMEYVGQALKWVTMHEVGHTLGLRHNFRSSFDTPNDKLGDRSWAEANGVFSSVMEYPALNLPDRGQPWGYVYNPGVGSYDRWAVAYGYAADPARAAAVAREAALPGHAYGTDEDANGPGALDPTTSVYDLGSDPLAWGKARAELIRSMWPGLPQRVLADNSRYADLTDAFNSLMFQYVRAVATGVKYIGGQYVNRDHVGDPQGRPAFRPVPREKQEEALAFLAEYGFGPDAFDIPREVLASLGPNRWAHWGEPNTINGRIDYPLHEQVVAVQSSLLNQITSPWVFSRIRDAERKFGPGGALPIPTLMESLTRAVWNEVWASPRNINSMRRDLQRAYLDRMSDLVATAETRMPGDGRSVARIRLIDLRGRVNRALASGGGLDAYTRAHLTEARARIDKALEAGMDVEKGR